MAKVEVSEEIKSGTEAAGAADLLIAIAAPVRVEDLRAAASHLSQSAAGPGRPGPDHAGPDPVGPDPAGNDKDNELSLENLRIAVAYPEAGGTTDAAAQTAASPEQAESGSRLRLLPYTLPGSPSVIPWLGLSTTYQTLFGMARELGVRACAVIASDLAGFKPDLLASLLEPVFAERCDLVMPVYPIGKFEGLLNSSILAPLTRVLYGRRVLFPLAPDFGISARLLPELEQPSQRISSRGDALFWPATEAALRNREICQVSFNARHEASGDGVDLSTILTQTVGPLFAEMEANAPLWQRTRPSQPVTLAGSLPVPAAEGASVDARPMIESFQLGFRNLQEVWGLVLPPVTLLELKRLAHMPPETFQMSDAVWVRIVYDFALAYRLRNLSRVHLLGALTPLYLAWAASHVLEVSRMHPIEVGHRVEKLARAYEEGKPYLLSRWRWPDRFTP